MWLTVFKRGGPLAPILAFFAFFLVVFTLDRFALSAYFFDQIAQVDKLWLIVPVGWRLDIIILCQALALPGLMLLLLPKKWGRWYNPVIIAFLIFVIVYFIVTEVASWPFLREYNSRPNQLFFQYLSHPKELFATIWNETKWFFALAIVLIGTFIFGFVKLYRTLFEHSHDWSYKARLLVLPFFVAIMFVGGRSSIGQANANPSLAAFSNNHVSNQIALNSAYSLSYSVYLSTNKKIRVEELYGTMPDDELIQRIRKNMLVEPSAFTSATVPTLHRQDTVVSSAKPRNLVVIVMESLGAQFVQSLGGVAVTPNLESLAKTGAYFTQVYSIGTRTSRGMEAMVAGFPPTTKGSSILKLDLAQHNFFSIGNLLKPAGYDGTFIYGGQAHYDGMSGFMLGNGFNHVIDDKDFENPNYRNAWGVSDEDVFARANAEFKQKTGPFFSVILTLSNHLPFDFPDGRVELYEQPKASGNNSARYSDYALGEFFRMARQEAYFKDTVFLITADHPMHLNSQDLVAVTKYHIPAIVIAPDLPPQQIDVIASQIDLLPTAVSLLGIPLSHPMVGRNLFVHKNPQFGRAMMVYDYSYAYRSGQDVVIYQPHLAPKQFQVDGEHLVESALNPELARDALAYILFSSRAYSQQWYKPSDK